MEDSINSTKPRKHNILGIDVNATTYDEALNFVIQAAQKRISTTVSHLAVHGLVEGSKDTQLRSMLNEFDIVAPDGQPVRLALNLLYNTNLSDRCYGPEFMIRVCQRAEIEGIGVYLYGSHPYVVETLRNALITRFQGLRIVGWEPSIFRPLKKAEDDALVQRINKSGAGIVFLGLGCPLQERFAYEHKDKIKAVLICNGAAFDFLSGKKKMAPEWMQRYALEWFFRLSQEPRRLWRRYFFTNMFFLTKLLYQFTSLKHITHKTNKAIRS